MKITYTIGVRIPTGKLFKEVGKIENTINEFMSGFGFDEKLVTTSVVETVLTIDRVPTVDEWYKIKKITIETFSESFGSAKIEYVIPHQ